MVQMGGLGVRRVSMLATSAFFALAAATLSFQDAILSKSGQVGEALAVGTAMNICYVAKPNPGRLLKTHPKTSGYADVRDDLPEAHTGVQ